MRGPSEDPLRTADIDDPLLSIILWQLVYKVRLISAFAHYMLSL